MKNMILTAAFIMMVLIVHANGNPPVKTISLPLSVQPGEDNSTVASDSNSSNKGNIIDLSQSTSYYSIYYNLSPSPDSDILSVKTYDNQPCVNNYNTCLSCTTKCGTPGSLGYGNCIQTCASNCNNSSWNWCVANGFGIPINPIKMQAVPAFTNGTITAGGITIGTAVTVKIGNMDLTSVTVNTYSAANSNISSISVTATGISATGVRSSPISLGNATYNSSDGYYELTISDGDLSSLAGDQTIELDADVANSYIPVTPGICSVPGHFPGMIVAPLTTPPPGHR